MACETVDGGVTDTDADVLTLLYFSQKGDTMAEAHMVTFHLRNGEQRTYKDITRLDTSRPHTVLVYYKDTLIAQIAKSDIVKITQQGGR
jgi:hypothetical protein